MPDYRLTLQIRDSEGGETSKSHTGTFADFATARTAADALIVDYEAAMDAAVYGTTLAETEAIATAPSGTRSVFRRVSASLSLVDKTAKANFKLPAPIAAINSAGSAFDPTATAWTNLVANFQAGGGWQVSDGDVVQTTVGGKTQFDSSGDSY
jgi:hypothetical protein